MTAPELTAEQQAADAYWRRFERPEPDVDRLPKVVLGVMLGLLLVALVALWLALAALP